MSGRGREREEMKTLWKKSELVGERGRGLREVGKGGGREQEVGTLTKLYTVYIVTTALLVITIPEENTYLAEMYLYTYTLIICLFQSYCIWFFLTIMHSQSCEFPNLQK